MMHCAASDLEVAGEAACRAGSARQPHLMAGEAGERGVDSSWLNPPAPKLPEASDLMAGEAGEAGVELAQPASHV